MITIRKLDGEKIRAGVIVSLIILSINLLQTNIGFYHPSYMMVLSALLLILSLVITIDLDFLKRQDLKNIVIFFVIAILFVIAFLYPKEISFKLLSISVFVYMLTFLTGNEHTRRILHALMAFSFSYSILIMILRGLPQMWLLFRDASYLLTKSISFPSGGLTIGPSFSGFWFLLSVIVLYLTFLIFDKEKRRPLIFLIISILAWILYIFVESLLQPDKSISIEIVSRANASILVFAFVEVIVIFLYVLFLGKLEPINLRLTRLRLGLVVTCLSLSFALLMLPYAPQYKGNVVIYREHMLGSWDKPEYGVYGNRSAGMFGLLPEYLSSLGFGVSFVEGSIDPGDLEFADVLVIINMNKALSEGEKRTVWNFVREGGSLLVMGDHTDVGGMMEPLNDLLEDVGISFRFDDALPLKREWLDCIEFLIHPSTLNFDPNLLSWSVGASLDVDPLKGGYPVIIGRYGYSDHGNYLNPDAYLGNYVWDRNEELGDIVLAASAFYGKGKVFVCGDTTSFQNSFLPLDYEFINSLFSWLSGKQDFYSYYLRVASGLLLIVLVPFVIYIRGASKNRSNNSLVIFTVIASLVLYNALIGFVEPRVDIGGRYAYIDASHGERFNMLPYTKGSLTGLFRNLFRNNLIVYVFREFSHDVISNASMFVTVSPTKRFNEEEILTLKELMGKGGLVLVSAGYSSREALLPILRSVGVDIIGLPLGSFPYGERNESGPRFIDAYPLVYETLNTTIFYSIEKRNITYPIVLFVRYGEGGCLVIGDGQYLLDKNIEFNGDYHLGNIDFLKDTFKILRFMGVKI